MDLNKLKEMLEETQKNFPPHYPTKKHDVANEVTILIENLKSIVDYTGFSNANIAIKNIVGKMINEFLISTNEVHEEENCNFEITNMAIENGTKTIVRAHEKSLDFEYLNNGVITITNNSNCIYALYGEDYSNCTIVYDRNKTDNLFLNQTFKNKSICQSMMCFNQEGIEMHKDFKIIPRTRNFEPTSECVLGSITRSEDFYTANVNLTVVGENFGKILSNDEIEQLKSIPEITVPVRYMGGLETDLNLLYVIIPSERDSFRSGAIQELVGNYVEHKGFEYSFDDHYAKSQEAIEHSNFLEFSNNTFHFMSPLIHAPYSFEILHNIKDYVDKKDYDTYSK